MSRRLRSISRHRKLFPPFFYRFNDSCLFSSLSFFDWYKFASFSVATDLSGF